MKSSALLPLLVSFLVLTAVAILQRSSRLVAALTATMPLTIPLSLWIVTAGGRDNPHSLLDFSRDLMWSIWPTVVFVVAVWVAARAGWRVAPAIAAGYLAWGLGVAVVLATRRVLGG